MTEETIVYLDPSEITKGKNSRYSLKPARVDQLAEDILDKGGVLVPIIVRQNGTGYVLLSGYGRHAAVEKLNKDGAGLKLPAIVRDVDDANVLGHQLSENVIRAELSPMDKAVSMRQMLDSGASREQVRRRFSAPGGRKGTAVQPLSNSMLNIYLSLLTLPKGIQAKVDNGLVSVTAAYELSKADPDKREAILEAAEEARSKQLAREEAMEDRFLKEQAKAEAEAAAQADAEKAVADAKAEVQEMVKLVAEKTKVVRDVNATLKVDATDADRKVFQEQFNGALADVKGAQKAKTDAEKKLSRAVIKANAAAKRADEKAAADAARAEEEAKAPKAKAKAEPIGPAAVKAASEKVDPKKGTKTLTVTELKASLKDALKVATPRVKKFIEHFEDLVMGVTTPKILVHDMGVLTGEVVAGKGNKKA